MGNLGMVLDAKRQTKFLAGYRIQEPFKIKVLYSLCYTTKNKKLTKCCNWMSAITLQKKHKFKMSILSGDNPSDDGLREGGADDCEYVGALLYHVVGGLYWLDLKTEKSKGSTQSNQYRRQKHYIEDEHYYFLPRCKSRESCRNVRLTSLRILQG